MKCGPDDIKVLRLAWLWLAARNNSDSKKNKTTAGACRGLLGRTPVCVLSPFVEVLHCQGGTL